METKLTNELKSHFLHLYEMAMADKDFSPLELKMLYHFAAEREISKAELDALLLKPSSEFVLPESFQKRLEYLYDLGRMVWADGVVTEDEKTTLRKFCVKFEIAEEHITGVCQTILDGVQNELSKQEIINQLDQLS